MKESRYPNKEAFEDYRDVRIGQLRKENDKLQALVDDFKSASPLEINGDPADIQPHHVEDKITQLRKRVEELEEEKKERYSSKINYKVLSDHYRKALEEIAEASCEEEERRTPHCECKDYIEDHRWWCCPCIAKEALKGENGCL